MALHLGNADVGVVKTITGIHSLQTAFPLKARSKPVPARDHATSQALGGQSRLAVVARKLQEF